MRQAFSALNYLHAQNISHRNIKAEAFILLQKGNHSIIKMVDFGLCKIHRSKEEVMNTVVGSPYYMSPEVF